MKLELFSLLLACTSCVQITYGVGIASHLFHLQQALYHLWLIQVRGVPSSQMSNFGNSVLIQSLLKIHFLL